MCIKKRASIFRILFDPTIPNNVYNQTEGAQNAITFSKSEF
jgi:hypothetical protein